MIALAPYPNCSAPVPPGRPEWSTRFLKMLPKIRRVARHAFCRLARDRREDAIQEVIANCFVAYARLVERGREQYAFPTPLTLFAVAQYRDGRRVGSVANRYDAMSAYGQRRGAVAVEPLCARGSCCQWEELVVADKRSTPADIAAMRIDFSAWLSQLDRRKRAAAKLLAGGAATSEAAAQLRVSPARISQLRRQLEWNWAKFQGEVSEVLAKSGLARAC